MEDTPTRLSRLARLAELGPEVEQVIASGEVPPPIVMPERVDPCVRAIQEGANLALLGSLYDAEYVVYSLRRSDAWSQDPQLTLPFDGPGAHPSSWKVYHTNARRYQRGGFYINNLEEKTSMLLEREVLPAILYFEAVHTALGAWQGRGESADLIDLLTDVARHAAIRLVVSSTEEGWARLSEKKPDFTSRFNVLRLAPFDETEARLIAALALGERGHTAAMMDEAFRLAKRHFGKEPPLRPVRRLLESASLIGAKTRDEDAVRHACARELGVGRRWVGGDQVPTSIEVVAELEEEVVGQSACMDIARGVVARARGLREPGTPISYLLVGGPGVGKTSAAVALQRMICGNDVPLLRFDCAEYSAPIDHFRLLANERGSLVAGLKQWPGSVVLFDEVDLAHDSVRDVLHELLEGRITSLDGEQVDSGNSIVLMTTNEGASTWLGSVFDDARRERAEAAARRACRRMLGAAVASRLDDILIFRPLAVEHLVSLVGREIAQVEGRDGLRERGVTLAVSEDLVAELTLLGASGSKGARGLKQAVRTLVAIPVSEYLGDSPDVSGRLKLEPIYENEDIIGVSVDTLGHGPEQRSVSHGHPLGPITRSGSQETSH